MRLHKEHGLNYTDSCKTGEVVEAKFSTSMSKCDFSLQIVFTKNKESCLESMAGALASKNQGHSQDALNEDSTDSKTPQSSEGKPNEISKEDDTGGERISSGHVKKSMGPSSPYPRSSIAMAAQQSEETRGKTTENFSEGDQNTREGGEEEV